MIDIDALFEKYFRNFVMKNSGRFTEDELEDKVGEIYSKFGSTPLKELYRLRHGDHPHPGRAAGASEAGQADL